MRTRERLKVEEREKKKREKGERKKGSEEGVNGLMDGWKEKKTFGCDVLAKGVTDCSSFALMSNVRKEAHYSLLLSQT